jgi:hypothetical protein
MEIGSWTIEVPRLNSMDLVTERRVQSRRGSHVDQNEDPCGRRTTQSTRPTLPKHGLHCEDKYRWSGPWYSSISAQQKRKANTGHATISFAVPRKLRRRREIRGLSSGSSVSETEPPGQRKTLAVRNAPRSCDSLELGALDDQLRCCDDFSLILRHWQRQCASDDPWFAGATLRTGIEGQRDLLNDEGVSRRLAVFESCD